MRCWITSRVANCLECDWEDADKELANKRAIQHSKKTGHEVSVEVARAFRYHYKRLIPLHSKGSDKNAIF